VGRIIRVSGPVVQAEGMRESSMYEVVYVGYERLIGEIIKLEEDIATIQVYENTSGVKPGEPVEGTGMPLSVELGPGLIGSIFDGIQRPLSVIFERAGPFVSRGIHIFALPRDKKWSFTPSRKAGEKIRGGEVLGYVEETPLVKHKILVPPTIRGTLREVAKEGEYRVEDLCAVVETPEGKTVELPFYHRWPIRAPRPYKERLPLSEPLLTGQRVIDTFFPVARGGCAAIPGGFGTGKTVTLHQLAAWSDADIVIYIGCGERGNEMTEVLISFPKLKDPRSGRPLMERTVLVANTSNMPVSAREASIYTGITMAEYFRDMGYDVALMADSTSRWAEALREISGRLEEMPAEEGFPPYLASRLGEFYERAGRVVTLSGEIGSVTIMGAVSPPGGDFTEPVTMHTKRFIRALWALDTALASMRHYPAINWLISYSDYIDVVENWWNERTGGLWKKYRVEAMKILQREEELKEIVRLVGPEALPEHEKLVLEVARMLREGFLRQNAYHPIDTYTPPEKQFYLLKGIVDFYYTAKRAMDRGVPFTKIKKLPVIFEIMRAKESIPNENLDQLKEFFDRALQEVQALEAGA